jgi:hypothetical protein
MHANDMHLRLQRLLRTHETVLQAEVATALPYDDPDMRLLTGNQSAPVFVAVTPARLIEIGQNDHASSGRWGDMSALSVRKVGRKWRYQWQRQGQNMPYQPMQVSSEMAELLTGVQAGRVPLMSLPEEWTTYSRVARPHDNSSVGQVAKKMGMAEVALLCDACGGTVGLGEPYGTECLVCHRQLSPAGDGSAS